MTEWTTEERACAVFELNRAIVILAQAIGGMTDRALARNEPGMRVAIGQLRRIIVELSAPPLGGVDPRRPQRGAGPQRSR